MANFDRPLPIGDVEKDYLQECLKEATIDTYFGELSKKYHSIHPAIGTIEVRNPMNAESKIKFSPSGWSRLYEQNVGDILKDLSGIIPNYDLPCEIKIIYSDNFGKEDSFKPSLTFNKSGKPELALNTEYVQIYSEDGINLLQNLWGKMIYRFDRKCSSLAEQLKLPPVYDGKPTS